MPQRRLHVVDEPESPVMVMGANDGLMLLLVVLLVVLGTPPPDADGNVPSCERGAGASLMRRMASDECALSSTAP